MKFHKKRKRKLIIFKNYKRIKTGFFIFCFVLLFFVLTLFIKPIKNINFNYYYIHTGCNEIYFVILIFIVILILTIIGSWEVWKTTMKKPFLDKKTAYKNNYQLFFLTLINIISVFTLGFLNYFLNYYKTMNILWINFLLIFLFQIIFVNIFYYFMNDKSIIKNLYFSILNIFVVFFLGIIFLIIKLLGWSGLLVIFLICWSNDIGAFYIGKKFGKPAPQLSKISPNKSFIGMIGGILSAFLILIIYYLIYKNWFNMNIFEFNNGIKVIYFLFFVFYLSIIEIFGDLIFSIIKRFFGVKDYSKLLGDHGGFLDRFDGFSLVTITFFVFLVIS